MFSLNPLLLLSSAVGLPGASPLTWPLLASNAALLLGRALSPKALWRAAITLVSLRATSFSSLSPPRQISRLTPPTSHLRSIFSALPVAVDGQVTPESFGFNGFLQGNVQFQKTTTPWKFNSSPLKMDGWKMSFLLGFPIFRGYCKLRGGKWLLVVSMVNPNQSWEWSHHQACEQLPPPKKGPARDPKKITTPFIIQKRKAGKKSPECSKKDNLQLKHPNEPSKNLPPIKKSPPNFFQKKKKGSPPRIPWVLFFRHGFFLVVPLKTLRFGNVRTRVLRLLVMSQLLAPLGGHPGGSIGNQPRVLPGGFFKVCLGDPKIGRFGGKKRFKKEKWRFFGVELSWVYWETFLSETKRW